MTQNSDQPEAVRIGVRELRGDLSRYLREASKGAAILVTSHDAVIAEIHPPSAKYASPRQPGALAGRIWLAEDFDELPPDILAAMEE